MTKRFTIHGTVVCMGLTAEENVYIRIQRCSTARQVSYAKNYLEAEGFYDIALKGKKGLAFDKVTATELMQSKNVDTTTETY